MWDPARGSVAGWAAVVALALTGCSDGVAAPEPATAPTEGSTLVPVDEEAPPRSVWFGLGEVRPGEPVSAPANSGDLPVAVDVVSLGGGEALGAQGIRGGALRLPAWEDSGPAHAILRIRGTGPSDVLSPGEDDFAFGADFNLDKVSSGTPADNGDNLIQRGLFEGPSQYKLQVDHQQLSCRVAGTDGALVAQLPERIEPGTWYRARCIRRVDTVTLMVAEVLPGLEVGEWTTATVTGPLGDVVMPRPTPMSVGGKLAIDGTIFAGSTDQLNGLVDRIMYRLVEAPHAG